MAYIAWWEGNKNNILDLLQPLQSARQFQAISNAWYLWKMLDTPHDDQKAEITFLSNPALCILDMSGTDKCEEDDEYLREKLLTKAI